MARWNRGKQLWSCRKCNQTFQTQRDAANCRHLMDDAKKVCEACEKQRLEMCPSCDGEGYKICRDCCEFSTMPCEIWDSVADSTNLEQNAEGISTISIEQLGVGVEFKFPQDWFKPPYTEFVLVSKEELSDGEWKIVFDPLVKTGVSNIEATIKSDTQFELLNTGSYGYESDEDDDYLPDSLKAESFEATESVGFCPECKTNSDYVCDSCAQCKRCCEASYGCYDVALCNGCDGSFIGKDIDGCCGSCDDCCECDRTYQNAESWLTKGKCAICNSPSKFTVMTAIGERSFCCEACYADYMGLPVEKEGYYGLEAETKKLPPVEKAEISGIASGATMEGLDLALGGEGTLEPCPHDAGIDSEEVSWLGEGDRVVHITGRCRDCSAEGEGYVQIDFEDGERWKDDEWGAETVSEVNFGKNRNYKISYLPEEEMVCPTCWEEGVKAPYLVACADYDPAPWDYAEHFFCLECAVRLIHDEENTPCEEDEEWASEMEKYDEFDGLYCKNCATKEMEHFELYVKNRNLCEDCNSGVIEVSPSLAHFKNAEDWEYAEHFSYNFTKERIEDRAPLTEEDLQQMVEILQNVPVQSLQQGIDLAEQYEDEPTMIVLVMALQTKKFREEWASEGEDDHIEMMECPHCSEFGDGEIPASVDYDPGDRWEPPSLDVNTWEICEYCGGDAEVEDTLENSKIPTWDWDYLTPPEPDYDRYEGRYDAETAEVCPHCKKELVDGVELHETFFCPSCDGEIYSSYINNVPAYEILGAESFEAENEVDATKILNQAIKAFISEYGGFHIPTLLGNWEHYKGKTGMTKVGDTHPEYEDYPIEKPEQTVGWQRPARFTDSIEDTMNKELGKYEHYQYKCPHTGSYPQGEVYFKSLIVSGENLRSNRVHYGDYRLRWKEVDSKWEGISQNTVNEIKKWTRKYQQRTGHNVSVLTKPIYQEYENEDDPDIVLVFTLAKNTTKNAETNGDRQLEESIKRTKMSAVRTGLAITTFGIVLWNLWTNKKQEQQIDDIMNLV